MVKYPGFIAITDGTKYTLNVDNSLFTVLVKRKYLPVKIIEFNNELIEKIDEADKTKMVLEFKNPINSSFDENSRALSQAEFHYILEYNLPEKYRTISNQYYTDLFIKFEVDDIKNDDEKKEKFWKNLNYFLNVYRVATGDAMIHLASSYHSKEILIHEKCFKYRDEDLNLDMYSRLNSSNYAGIHKMDLVELSLGDFRKNKSKETYPIETNTQNLFSYIEREHKFKSIDILVKAKEELYHNYYYKYAFLDALIFIESIISQFLLDQYLLKGLTKTKFNKEMKEVDISKKITIHLPKFLNQPNESEEKSLKDWTMINTIRNKVIHAGREITRHEAEKAIQCAEEILALLLNHSKDKI